MVKAVSFLHAHQDKLQKYASVHVIGITVVCKKPRCSKLWVTKEVDDMIAGLKKCNRVQMYGRY